MARGWRSMVRRAWRAALRRWPQSTRPGYQLRRLRSHLPPPDSGPMLVPLLLEAFARDHPDATVVQVGSNDGIKLDPLRRHLMRRRWRAFLLEPVPYVYDQLVANTRFNPRITPVNVAIGPVDGTMDFHHLPPTDDPDVPGWYDALGSFRRDVVLSHRGHIPDIDERLVTTAVPTVTFDTFVERYGIDCIDLLHVDTEGFDLEVLRLVDLARFAPSIVLFERHHLDEEEQEEARRLLAELGYELHHEGLDTVAVRRPDTAGQPAAWVDVWHTGTGETR